MTSQNPFEDFGDLFNKSFGDAAESLNKVKPPAKKAERGLPWEAKYIDGKMYLPLAQVVELLKQNEVLPAVRRGLERHLK